ncbi:MAG: PPOX class F420-dependent oxidoreductase [Candidatus Binatia bacterium]
MAKNIPAAVRDILDSTALAHLATVMPDGSPQVSPVWFDFDGRLRINSARGRVKDRNMRRDARVALSLVDPNDPNRGITIRGKITDVTENGADAHIDKLAKKYLGVDKYPYRGPGEVRVIYTIEPTHISAIG